MQATNREHWRAVDNYLNYEVSSDGRVRNATTGKSLKACDNNTSGYFRVGLYKNGKTKFYYVHKLVSEAFLDNPKGCTQADHMDSNRKNNCVENLRWASGKDNQGNKQKQTKPTSSQFKGVYFNKQSRKWKAQICIDWKTKHLGYFSDEREAAEKYNAAAIEYFGEFAKLNVFED